jgi:riboflavin synthase
VFTGLVEGTAKVLAFERRGKGASLELARPSLTLGGAWKPTRGESLALNGCCLSVARRDASGRTSFDLTRETLELTTFGALVAGGRVNVERSLRLGDRLGGHLVSGHVDGVGRLVRASDSRDGGRRLTFEVPRGFERYLVSKGSIAIDGVSVTVVRPSGRRFEVAVIPETLRVTNLGSMAVGTRVHLEADAIGKWIERLFARTPRRARS